MHTTDRFCELHHTLAVEFSVNRGDDRTQAQGEADNADKSSKGGRLVIGRFRRDVGERTPGLFGVSTQGESR
jgi:hypothetical protein